MNKLAELRSKNGKSTYLGYDFTSSFEELVQQGLIDCCIHSTEDGFSPLGGTRKFISSELGIAEEVIGELADWNRFENEEISIIGLPNRKPEGNLKGVVLAASETSECYKQFAPAYHSKPYRDFYYNVAFESIHYCVKTLGATKLAMFHLSGNRHFHEDIATCVAEALAHFCDTEGNPNINSFIFVGCCIEPSHLLGIQRLNLEGNVTRHRKIIARKSEFNGFEVISFDLS
jgi:hypothetical protein